MARKSRSARTARRPYQCERRNIWLNDVESEHEPMMLYVYPLDREPTDEEIAALCEQTACNVFERRYRDGEGTGEFFLALCGGGMDQSQDVALAYVLARSRSRSSRSRSARSAGSRNTASSGAS